MHVLVDTSVWSLALRRNLADLDHHERLLAAELRELVREHRVQLIGPVRQELLSGIRDQAQFVRLKGALRAYRDVTLTVEDYEDAASYSNRCRSRGITGSPTDFLICAAAALRDWSIFTRDSDFDSYRKAVSVRLHSPRRDPDGGAP